MQVHYLSWRTQNEFIASCADYVRKVIVDELKRSKYYSIMVDSTPDSSHVEQTSFVFRYIIFKEDAKEYEIYERFLEFSDCNEKTGEDIPNLIKEVLKKYDVSLDDCRGQGFDNGSNVSGKYKGHILKSNPLAVYSLCGCHSLSLCGVCAAESC
ncbi:unnamed protein product [Diabrotica balteata]|uniref:DUF4371 domain-containing protein n=1 Tax=Diabrotica balteata TaxID=107213 RepID=A0A9N9XDW8_DIABA|nr:unnamed protein product [Diabrotica balteata]